MQMHHQTAARLFRVKNCRLVCSQAQQVRVHLILGHEKVAARAWRVLTLAAKIFDDCIRSAACDACSIGESGRLERGYTLKARFFLRWGILSH